MRTAFLILVLAALSAASSLQGDMDDLSSKASYYKIMESCLGKNTTVKFAIHVKKTLRECNDASPDGFELTSAGLESSVWEKLFDDYAANVTGGSAGNTNDSSAYSDRSTNDTNSRTNDTNSSTNDTNSRTNDTNSSTNGTNSSANDTKSRANDTNGSSSSTNGSNNDTGLFAPLVEKIRCTYQRLNMTSSDNTIDADKMKANYKTMNLAPKLEAELVAGVDMCNEIAQCLPLDKNVDSRMPEDLLRLKTFLKCTEVNLRNGVCLRVYLQNSATSCNVDLGSQGTSSSSPDNNATTTAISDTD